MNEMLFSMREKTPEQLLQGFSLSSGLVISTESYHSGRVCLFGHHVCRPNGHGLRGREDMAGRVGSRVCGDPGKTD